MSNVCESVRVRLVLCSDLARGEHVVCGRVELSSDGDLDRDDLKEIACFEDDDDYVKVYEFDARPGEVYRIRGVMEGRGRVDHYFTVDEHGVFKDVLPANNAWSKYRVWQYLRGEISALE